MSEPAVIQATWSDWQTVKTRNSLKLIFEVPLDQQQRVLSVLGPPLPNSETWVAIARLQAPTAPPERAPEPPDDEEPEDGVPSQTIIDAAKLRNKLRNPDAADRARQNYRDKDIMAKAVVRASMLCDEPAFAYFLSATPGADCADALRGTLLVKSRSEIGTSERAYKAFLALETDYNIAVGRAARPS